MHMMCDEDRRNGIAGLFSGHAISPWPDMVTLIAAAEAQLFTALSWDKVSTKAVATYYVCSV